MKISVLLSFLLLISSISFGQDILKMDLPKRKKDKLINAQDSLKKIIPSIEKVVSKDSSGTSSTDKKLKEPSNPLKDSCQKNHDLSQLVFLEGEAYELYGYLADKTDSLVFNGFTHDRYTKMDNSQLIEFGKIYNDSTSFIPENGISDMCLFTPNLGVVLKTRSENKELHLLFDMNCDIGKIGYPDPATGKITELKRFDVKRLQGLYYRLFPQQATTMGFKFSENPSSQSEDSSKNNQGYTY